MQRNFKRMGSAPLMKPEPLLAAFAKLERSVAQIGDFNDRISAFFQTNPYQVLAELNADRTCQVWKWRLARKLPLEWAVIAGEILHNLRSPIDQVVAAVAVLHCGQESGVAFPFGRNLQEFETALGKQKKLPADARDLIRALKPYKGGNDLLWALHYLNKRDKHRSHLVPINMPSETSVSYICFWKGLPLVIGCKNGEHLLMEKPFTDQDLMETGKPLALYDVRPGRIIFGEAGTAGDESLEFMTTTAGAVFEADFYPSLNVGFADVGLDGKPVIIALNEMRQLVERILLTFEDRFFA